MLLSLEDFAVDDDGRTGNLIGSQAAAKAEQESASAYESGYKAGWDDAVNAEADDQTRISAEFARHLQEISFTFHEARAHIIKSIMPVLTGMVEKILPETARATLGPQILEILQPMIADLAENPVEIAVAPANLPLLEPILAEAGLPAVQLREETTLSEGQAFLRVGRVEKKIDLAEAIEQIHDAVNALSQLNERVLKHG